MSRGRAMVLGVALAMAPSCRTVQESSADVVVASREDGSLQAVAAAEGHSTEGPEGGLDVKYTAGEPDAGTIRFDLTRWGGPEVTAPAPKPGTPIHIRASGSAGSDAGWAASASIDAGYSEDVDLDVELADFVEHEPAAGLLWWAKALGVAVALMGVVAAIRLWRTP